jgi:site-specific recombinase XerD
MLQLLNNCQCSQPTVAPKNWKNGPVSLLKKDWYIQYYFRDAAFAHQHPNGKLIIVKGMNKYKTLVERRQATQTALDLELDMLTNYQYNPITGFRKDTIKENNEHEISPDTLFFDALHDAFEKMDCGNETKIDIKSILKYVSSTGEQLGYHKLPISQVRRKHIKIILDQVGKMTSVNYTANRYNVYRKYLHRLFEELIQLEAIESNPVKGIAKKTTIKKMRQVLTIKEREAVNKHLKINHYTFWRFCQILFHSGARITELLQIKKSGVDLKTQTFQNTIKKGKQHQEVRGTIKDIILFLWAELIKDANMNDYIFSKNLSPGPVSINAKQITIRWRSHVKKKLEITADIYSLKHSNLDETAAILDARSASKMAKHTNTAITMNHYLIGEKQREHERLKKVDNEF